MPTVRILGELTDTALRQFPISTVLQLTCKGQIGNDASKVRAENHAWASEGVCNNKHCRNLCFGFSQSLLICLPN